MCRGRLLAVSTLGCSNGPRVSVWLASTTRVPARNADLSLSLSRRRLESTERVSAIPVVVALNRLAYVIHWSLSSWPHSQPKPRARLLKTKQAGVRSAFSVSGYAERAPQAGRAEPVTGARQPGPSRPPP